MKKFILPALVMVFLVGLIALGAFVYKTSGNRRFAAEKGEEIKINNKKLKIKNEKSKNRNIAGIENYNTPGIVSRNGRILSINGVFQRWQDIPNSKDKYIVIDASSDQPIPKLRVVLSKHDDVKRVTQLSYLRLQNNINNVHDALVLVGSLDKVSEDELNLLIRPGVWLSVLPYYEKKDGQVKLKTCGDNCYYVRAITTQER